jgi:mannose-1-phosphate guanylyltransferase
MFVKTNIMKDTALIIMAGGVGSRFWPASRENLPKQFMDITGSGKSLIRLTYERFVNMGIKPEHVWVVTHKNYVKLTQEHLPEISLDRILGEPMRRNTAPAALLGSLAVHKTIGDKPIVMAPADHFIANTEVFEDVITQGIRFVSGHDSILTIGIKPEYAHTGYGYIHYDEQSRLPHNVYRFTEKPDKISAQKFVDEGNYLWNAGIFLWRPRVIEESYKTHAETMYGLMSGSLPWSGGVPKASRLEEVYDLLENISIDYQIIENADNVFTIPADFGWSDVGSWRSLYDLASKDENENAVLSGKALLEDSRGNFIRTKEKLVIAKGLENYMIIEENDVLVICPVKDDQEIKKWRQEVINNISGDYE